MRRRVSLAILALVLGVFAPAIAGAQQSVSLHLGGFVPRGIDARDDSDVFVANLFNGDESLGFEVEDFRGGRVGLEWLTAFGSNLEAGLGIGYYRRTVPSVYAFLVEDDGTEIEQDLRLRVVPFSATLRLLPFGRDGAIQPYVGAGVGILSWRYSEVGEFVDFDGSVFQGRFAGSGTDAGPLVLVGARFPAGSWTVGGEVRYQTAEGNLPEGEFLGAVIDLGGFNYLLTFTARF
jgi:hypothetical protein